MLLLWLKGQMGHTHTHTHTHRHRHTEKHALTQAHPYTHRGTRTTPTHTHKHAHTHTYAHTLVGGQMDALCHYGRTLLVGVAILSLRGHSSQVERERAGRGSETLNRVSGVYVILFSC